MPKTDKPNILVIWGDDIGISNLSCYTHGSWVTKTPNIDRLAKEGMMFTDSYGEQSAPRAARPLSPARASIVPACPKSAFLALPIGMNEKLVTIAGCLKNQGYATGQFGKNHLGDLNKICRPITASTSSLATSTTSTPRRSPRLYGLLHGKDFPNFTKNVRTTRRPALLGDRQRRPDGASALGQRRQTEDRGHRPAHQEADGDLRRRFRRQRPKISLSDRQRRRQAVLHLAQLHPHAPVHPHQA